MSFLELAICEAENNGEIDLDTRDNLLTVLTEGSINPLKKFVERIRAIRETKPDEYDGPEEIKKYIDKNGEDLIAAAKLLEREPEKLRKSEISWSVGVILSSIGALVFGMAKPAFCMVPIVGTLLMIVISIIYMVIIYVRANADTKVSNDLSKIRASLKKIDSSKLPDNYKKKISKVVTAIDDAETEISSRIKVQKESVLEEIYEAELCGDITPEERSALIDYLND